MNMPKGRRFNVTKSGTTIISTSAVGENFLGQHIDWQNINVNSMGGDGFDKPMADKTMYGPLGIPSDSEDEEDSPISEIDEDEDNQIELKQEIGDDVIGESLMEEAVIPVDDEVTSELAIKYDPDQPIIRMGTYFTNMVEFMKAFGKFCINGEFDVFRYEAKRRLEYNNTERVKVNCPWKISARILPGGEIVRVLRS
jgi:hypothetical protein